MDFSKTSFVSSMKAHVFRLKPDDDLYQSLMAYIKLNNIKAACILTCVGSLKKCYVRTATGKRFIDKIRCFEITSLTGCVSEKRNHIHITLTDDEGVAIGGHLMSEGNIVYTTAEIVLGVLQDLEFDEFHCEKSQWPELKITQK